MPPPRTARGRGRLHESGARVGSPSKKALSDFDLESIGTAWTYVSYFTREIHFLRGPSSAPCLQRVSEGKLDYAVHGWLSNVPPKQRASLRYGTADGDPSTWKSCPRRQL